MKNKLLVIAGLLFCVFTFAQNVNIPDANFKAYLVGNTAINTNGDTEIQVSEANNYSGSIGCSGENITSMIGIEAFTSLIILNCTSNQLTSLDLSKNTALYALSCGDNQLTSLDLSKNTALTVLSCGDNQLTSLDFSKNTALIALTCETNQLTSLDVSKNTAIIALTCFSNQLTSLDLSKNTALTVLSCGDNQLTSLDVSKNTALTGLACGDNQLTSLDLSKNTALTALFCYSNQLTSLNVKNGNNMLTSDSDYGSINNPSLICIQVDNVAYSNTNWTHKDSWASYSTNCNYMSVNDVQKPTIKVFPNPVKNILNIQAEDKLQKVEIYSANGQLLKISFLKEINVANLPKGNYVVKIITNKGIQTEKLIKD